MARILLIDDEDPIRTLMRRILEPSGHAVFEARNGAEGLALFRDAPTDVVITDMVMPAVEGFEVLRVLREIHPPVKIIAISGAALWENHLRMASHLGRRPRSPSRLLQTSWSRRSTRCWTKGARERPLTTGTEVYHSRRVWPRRLLLIGSRMSGVTWSEAGTHKSAGSLIGCRATAAC